MFSFAADPILISRHPFHDATARLPGRFALAALCFLAVAIGAFSQSPATTSEGQPPAGSNAPAAKQLPRVTTTIEVHGDVKDEYLTDDLTVGSLDGATLKEAPLSATR